MKKEFKKAIIIVGISVLVCSVLGACNSKKVKNNGNSTSKVFTYKPVEWKVEEELKVEIFGIGKNIVRVDLSKPEIEKIYEERQQFEYDRIVGGEIDSSYRYEMEVYLKKGEEVKFTIKANKFGIAITSQDKMSDGKYINQKSGGIDGEWIIKKRIMEIQFIYPGIVELVKECDNYEVYFVDMENETRDAIHKENNQIDEPFPMSGPSYREKMYFNVECEDDNTAWVELRGYNFSGATFEEVLITLGEKEDRYILYQAIDSYSEIETIDVLLKDEDYLSERIDLRANFEPMYKVELGEVVYHENGEREFVPMLAESGNVYNAPVSSNYNNFLIKREGIKDFFSDCNICRGYVGDDFEEFVYLVIR